jgi:aquaporin NIP
MTISNNSRCRNSRGIHIILSSLRGEQKEYTKRTLSIVSMKKCSAEFIGTFALVFAGTGAIVINETSGGAITHVGISLTFGLIVLAMIYTVGDISGAHLNPAENATLGSTQPVGSATQSFILELILTAILMFVILSVSTGAAEKGITAGIAVGSVIGLEAMFAGPICGASMNPARSLAPAMVSQHLSNLWIYLVAPAIGALLGVVGCRCVREEGCCSTRCTGTTSVS